jgi:putative ABC transport system permease protein
MPFPLFLRLAARNLVRRKRRNSLSFLGILLGVILLVCLGTAIDSANNNFRELVIRATGNVDLSITSAVGRSFPTEVLSRVRSTENVTQAAGRVAGEGHIYFWNQTFRKEEKEAVNVIGVAHGDYDYLDERYTKITGTKILTGNMVVVDSRLGLREGDSLKIRVLGQYYDLEVAGVYHPPPLIKGIGEVGKRIYIDLPLAQKVFKTYGRYTAIIAKVRDFRDVDRVVEDLGEELGSRYRVSASKRQLMQQINRLMEGYSLDMLFLTVLVFTIAIVVIFDMQYMNTRNRVSEIGMLRGMGMTRIQILAMLISEGLITGVIASLLGTPLGVEFARQMGSVILFPAASFVLTNPQTTPSLEYAKIIISYNYIYAGIIVGPLITTLASSVPSFMASRQSIVSTVRRGVTRSEERWLPIFSTISGILLLWVGNDLAMVRETGNFLGLMSIPAFLLGGIALATGFLKIYAVLWRYLSQPFLRRLGSMMSRSMTRNTTRTAVSLSLICTTLTLYLTVAPMTGSMDTSLADNMERLFPADIIVFSEEKIPADLYKNILDIDGGTLIDFVAGTIGFETRLKTTDGKTGNYTAPMMGIDVRYFPEVVDVKLSEDTLDGTYYKLMQPDTILLSRPVATSLGNLTVGSKVEILSTERVEAAGLIFYVPTWRTFKVIGIAETNPSSILSFGGPSLGDPCYISYSTLTDQFGHIGDYATSFFIEVKDEYEDQLTFVKDKIRARFADKYSLGIITRHDLIEEVKEDMQAELALFNVMEIAGFLIGVLGIAATMIMNIDERKKEIAVLRSMGCSHYQLSILILGEATAVALLSFTISVPVSYRIHILIIEWVSLYGFEMVQHFTIGPVMISAAAAFTMSILGAVYPTYRALRFSIIETLRETG